jgi:hypothetical protein
MVLVSATVVFGSFLAIDFINFCQKRTVESTLAEFLSNVDNNMEDADC